MALVACAALSLSLALPLQGQPPGGATADVLQLPIIPDPSKREGPPLGWEIQAHRGTPAPALEKRGNRHYLRLSSRGDTAWGIKREVQVDLREFPFLEWTWKADRLPRGGDVRRRDADDQALQVYVVFPGTSFPRRLTSTALAYVWDNLAPRGLVTGSPQPTMRRVRVVVLRNGQEPPGAWFTEKRNVLQDARALYRDLGLGEPPPTEGVILFVNTHKTGGHAEGRIGDIRFTRR